MLNPLSNFTLAINNTSATTVTRSVLQTTIIEGPDSAASSSASGTIVSSLARQLSDAAVRADVREATLDLHTLTQKAQALVGELVGAAYLANKTLHDAEVPDTEDADLLARARQATDFLNGNASNPFENLSREQLSLIVYDESDTFTVNERRAALKAADEQEQAWRQMNAHHGQDEYEATGKVTGALKEALEHYRALPAMDRAQYPEHFQGDLIVKVIYSMENVPVKPLETLAGLWGTVQDLFKEGRFDGPQASGETDKTATSDQDEPPTQAS